MQELPGQRAKAQREKRLAEALRANLRRRKAAGSSPADRRDKATEKPERDPP